MSRTRRRTKGSRPAALAMAEPRPPEPSVAPPPGPWDRADRLITAALFLLTAILFVPTVFNDFIQFDDHEYINLQVQKGLTWEGVKYAFTTTDFGNWLPITWLSHMLDVELFGINPAGHHATSVILHAINAALLFAAMRFLTGSRWRSALVALLFAVHPLRVESVSWAAERKDVLCGTFFMLMLLAYARYCRQATAGRYALVLLFYALGLMSKTMIVTAPCLLLLLDWWPLGRVRWLRPTGGLPPSLQRGESAIAQHSIGRLVLEKAPLLVMALAASAWTVVLQRTQGHMDYLDALSFPQRLGNALVSIWRYVGKTLAPVNLSIYYKHPGWWPTPAVVASALGLVVAAVLIVWAARRAPYVLVGCCWFVGVISPVLGFLQSGRQSMADRFTYLPGIGFALAIVWGAAALRARYAAIRGLLTIVGSVWLAMLCALTVVQQSYWKDSLEIFSHALAVDPDDWQANQWVGSHFYYKGDYDLSIQFHRRAIAHEPDDQPSRSMLGLALLKQGKLDEAEAELRELVRRYPWTGVALAVTLIQKKDYNGAIDVLAQTQKLSPADPEIYIHWSTCLLALGRTAEAEEKAAEAVRIAPANPYAQEALATARQRRGSSAGPGSLPSTAPTGR